MSGNSRKAYSLSKQQEKDETEYFLEKLTSLSLEVSKKASDDNDPNTQFIKGNKLKVHENEEELNKRIEEELKKMPRIQRYIKSYSAIYGDIKEKRLQLKESENVKQDTEAFKILS